MSQNGFNNTWGGIPYSDLLGDSLRDGLALAATLTGSYDTNPSQGYGPAADSGQGDFMVSLGGSANYRSTASTWTFGASYSGAYNQYFNQSELSGYNQNAGASANYNGGPLSATLSLGIDFGSGANRYYASVVDQIGLSYGLNARYTLSPKTFLTGNLSQRLTSASGEGNSDTSSFDLGASALWKYSRLTEFGPGIRYTNESGASGGDRTSIGPTLTVNYQLSRKVSLNSVVGSDFPKYEDGGSADPSLYTSIALNYRASDLWGMNFAVLRDTQPSYTNGSQFQEVTTLRLGFNRRLRAATWNLGFNWENRTTDNPDPLRNPDTPNQTYLSYDTSIGMPVFASTCNASWFLRYSDQNGGSEQDWDSLQTGFSISRSF